MKWISIKDELPKEGSTVIAGTLFCGLEIPDKDAFVIADYYQGNFIRPYIHEVEIIPYIDYWAPIAPLPKDGD